MAGLFDFLFGARAGRTGHPLIDAPQPQQPPDSRSVLLGDLIGGEGAEGYQAQFGRDIAPAIGSYLRDVLTGQYARQGLEQLQSHYDPARSLAENARDPRGLENAFNIAMAFGPGSIKAYHGSPRDFNKFDTSEIGTGEGAQAYGHGLYFAENEGVARSYRDALQKTIGAHNTFDGQRINPTLIKKLQQSSDPVVSDFFKRNETLATTNGRGLIETLDDRIAGAQKEMEHAITRASELREGYASGRIAASTYKPEHFDEIAKNNADYLSQLKRIREAIEYKEPQPTGRMYEVNINAEPQQFLDWDKPLAEQAQQIQDVFKQYGIGPERRRILGRSEPRTGENAYKTLSGYQPDPVKASQDLPRNPELASKILRESGIPGIRYLDQGSRGAGEGTHNYVVFSPELITILRKYGLLGPAVGLGAYGSQRGDAP